MNRRRRSSAVKAPAAGPLPRWRGWWVRRVALPKSMPAQSRQGVALPLHHHRSHARGTCHLDVVLGSARRHLCVGIASSGGSGCSSSAGTLARLVLALRLFRKILPCNINNGLDPFAPLGFLQDVVPVAGGSRGEFDLAGRHLGLLEICLERSISDTSRPAGLAVWSSQGSIALSVLQCDCPIFGS